MILLTVDEIIMLHGKLLKTTGGLPGLRDRGLLESAVLGINVSFEDIEQYPAQFNDLQEVTAPVDIVREYETHQPTGRSVRISKRYYIYWEGYRHPAPGLAGGLVNDSDTPLKSA